MPRMDGLSCLRVIKEYDSNAKVVICSSLGKENLVKDAVKLGAVDFIIKPFNSEHFINKIKQILSNKNKN